MAANDVLFREAGISTIASGDLKQSHVITKPVTSEGHVAWMSDGFGKLRMFTYRLNVSGSALALGDLTSRLREVESNQTGTVTTSVTGSTTADNHIGALAIVIDDAGGAGAAPEGEASIVASNTATVWTLEGDLPFSTALASGDDLHFISPKITDAADGDFNFVVCGVAMAAAADDEWSWQQFQGVHPRVQHKTTSTHVAGDPVVADAAAVGPWGSDAAVLWVGVQMATGSNDALQIKSPVLMTLLPSYM